jgi:hypothetical protein
VQRLWIGNEDYGTAGDEQAELWLAYQRERYPDVVARIETVADDAPLFLPNKRKTHRWRQFYQNLAMTPKEIEALPVVLVTPDEAREHREDPGFVTIPHYAPEVQRVQNEIGYDESARYAYPQAT